MRGVGSKIQDWQLEKLDAETDDSRVNEEREIQRPRAVQRLLQARLT
jgi:hypothetical protein